MTNGKPKLGKLVLDLNEPASRMAALYYAEILERTNPKKATEIVAAVEGMTPNPNELPPGDGIGALPRGQF